MPLKFALSLGLATMVLLGCEGEINTNPDAIGSTPSPNQAPGSENDSFLDANRVNLDSNFSGQLSEEDVVDYYFIELPLNTYRAYDIALTELSGDADIELYNAYLNRESWSESAGLDDELIQYWRNYTDLDNNIVYVKVINKTNSEVNYTMTVTSI